MKKIKSDIDFSVFVGEKSRYSDLKSQQNCPYYFKKNTYEPVINQTYSLYIKVRKFPTLLLSDPHTYTFTAHTPLLFLYFSSSFLSLSMASSLHPSLFSASLDLPKTHSIFGTHLKLGEFERTLLRLSTNFNKISPSVSIKGSRVPPGLTAEPEYSMAKMTEETAKGSDSFSDMKQGFLSFKKDKYLKNTDYFESLANAQAPKFTVIACADSRVCPSVILGLQPGEAFTVRNVANLVPPFESGPTETKAALEFSVNALQVENILVIGHSRCGGIRALMSMPEEEEDSRSFISSWVITGKNARLSTKSAVPNHDLDQQCQHCEKESINHSLMNLLTYPWIKERVVEGKLSLHGGYYNFVDCTFEKWTLDCGGRDGGSACSITNREVWS